MNLEALNDPELLDDTPIGRLRVIAWGGRPAVAIMHPHDPERVKRVIHMLKPFENPLNAIYGKRAFEGQSVWAKYQRALERERKSQESKRDDMSKDLQADINKQLEKSWDGSFKEALLRAMGVKPKR